MKKFLLILISVILCNVAFSRETDYLEYADIPDTDIINMNWQFDWNIYEVYIDTWSISYVTWSDEKLHNCFKLVWTWYTEKLGEIYFQYEWHGSYICDDFKLRWVFKIWAWGRWYMEDLENDPEEWKNYLDKTDTEWWYYHNGNGDGTGTWQAFLDGIGFSNWNTVKTKTNLSSYFSKISITPAIRWTNVNADWETQADIDILVKYNGDILKNFTVNNIYFKKWYNSDVFLNWVEIAWLEYSWTKTTDDNWIIKWKVTSLNWNKNIEYGLNVTIWDYDIVAERTTSAFKYPFDINLSLKYKEAYNKILVWYTNQAKLSISVNNIDSLDISNNSNSINYWIYNDYFITENWNNIQIDGNYHDIKVSYKKFFKYDNIDIQYNITGDYTFSKNGNEYLVKNFEYVTNTWSIYKDWEVASVEINNNGVIPQADGKSSIIYSILFLDKNWFKINNLDYNLSITDPNKYFDLTLDDTYTSWYLIQEWRDTTNWIYGFSLKSYKPVNSANLDWLIQNITYNWHYTFNNSDKNIDISNINFLNVVDSSFEDKILKINRDDTINYSYQNNLGSNISNPYFIFTGYTEDCDSCNFVKGKELKWNDFDDYSFDILIESDESPSAVIYSGYYQYYLDGDDGNKLVQIKQIKKYSPLLFIQSWKIKILWNILTNKDIIWGVNYIATNINPTYIKNKLKKIRYDKFIKWTDIINIITDQIISLNALTKNKYVYKCNNNTLSIDWSYDHNIDIYTLGCKINIDDNIISNWWHLSIYAFSNNEVPNLYEDNWWDIGWNIYINSQVKTIQASLITEWSIFTYKDSLSPDNIFNVDRINDTAFKNQLYIRWKVYSKNTLWWGNKYSDGTYMIINWKKINENNPPTEWLFWEYPLKNIAQAYDISFFKSKFVHEDWTYSTWDISEYIYKKYNCSWDTATDNDICYTNLVIEDSK